MVNEFVRQIKDAILGPDGEQVDADANYEDASNPGQYGNVRPASEDPYGDPADQYGQFGDVRPASEDPYGDPADYTADAGMFGDVRPASEDPYGDPADEEGFS
jgi:hypothetical protein